MLKTTQKPRHEITGIQQATRFAALAFFLYLATAPQPSNAVTNQVDGIAFGTNYVELATTNSIASVANGAGSLEIGYAGTTNLSLSHDINGYIIVSNGFDTLSIDATGGKVSGSNYAVLAVLGGTNLTISGGQFIGTTSTNGTLTPPFPGESAQSNLVSSAAIGGIIFNTENVQISKADFSGAAYAPYENLSMGTEGLKLVGTTAVFADNGANSSTVTGGSGEAVNFNGADAWSVGGTALYAADSTVVISNGTFNGGAGGNVNSSSSFFAITQGGNALYATNSTIEIHDGTFNGGNGGTAIASGSGMSYSYGAAAVYARDSSLQISGGTFTGGTADSSDVSYGGEALYATNSTIDISGSAVFTGGTNAAALFARNSDIVIDGGTFQGGSFGTNSYFGLVSIADASTTNDIALNSGTFNSIDFAGNGTQLLTTGAGLQIDGFLVLDGSTLIVDNASSSAFQDVLIRSGDMQLLNDYTLYNDGSLEFVIVTNSHGTLTAPTASFETNSTIRVDASQANFSFGTNDVVLVSAAGGIYVIDAGGITNAATSTNLAENVNYEATVFGRTQLSDVLVGSGSNLVFRFTTQHLKDYWNATGQFGVFSDELESLINPEMDTTINLINDPALSSAAVEQTYFTTFNSFQTALQGMRAAVGQSLSRGSEFRQQLQLIPVGARGPIQNFGQKENRMRGWGKYYGNYYTHSESGLTPSYDTGLQGGVLGVDASIGKLLLGISGGASRYETTFDGSAREKTTAVQGSVYGTYGGERGYIDGGLTYGENQVETRTAEPFRLDGEFDAQVASAYLGGGYDLIDTKGGTVFTPEASFQYSMYNQDKYTETSSVAVPRSFDEFDADSMLGSIGMNIAMQKRKVLETVAFQLDGRLHWMHEFNPDPSAMKFMLDGGSNSYALAYPELDQDIYRIGVGCSFFNRGRSKPKNVMFRIDFDELFGQDFNSHNLSAKITYAF